VDFPLPVRRATHLVAIPDWCSTFAKKTLMLIQFSFLVSFFCKKVSDVELILTLQYNKLLKFFKILYTDWAL
jgi:hypothetical protein